MRCTKKTVRKGIITEVEMSTDEEAYKQLVRMFYLDKMSDESLVSEYNESKDKITAIEYIEDGHISYNFTEIK